MDLAWVPLRPTLNEIRVAESADFEGEYILSAQAIGISKGAGKGRAGLAEPQYTDSRHDCSTAVTVSTPFALLGRVRIDAPQVKVHREDLG